MTATMAPTETKPDEPAEQPPTSAPAPAALPEAKEPPPPPAKTKPSIWVKKKQREEFQLLHFQATGRATLEDLAKLTFPKLNPDKGAVIVGGKAEWVAALVGHCIDANLPWVAIYDRRHGKNGAGLVTNCYCQEPKLWDLIEFDL